MITVPSTIKDAWTQLGNPLAARIREEAEHPRIQQVEWQLVWEANAYLWEAQRVTKSSFALHSDVLSQ